MFFRTLNLFPFQAKETSESKDSRKTSTSSTPDRSRQSGDTINSKLFSRKTRAIIWGLQTKAVQGMMDYDYVCGRTTPSVAAMVYPMVGGDSKQQFYWGHKEVLVPIYKSMADAMKNHRDADIMVSWSMIRK